ncbi:MAG: right-handed parallel beta-helix repeat-containing protein, partial [Candidatus Diapherotrites archaeon]|nr:right-handed parallel beta-helix repeat-containing protein [Candidatus Diapherotrites archaeon]
MNLKLLGVLLAVLLLASGAVAWKNNGLISVQVEGTNVSAKIIEMVSLEEISGKEFTFPSTGTGSMRIEIPLKSGSGTPYRLSFIIPFESYNQKSLFSIHPPTYVLARSSLGEGEVENGPCGPPSYSTPAPRSGYDITSMQYSSCGLSFDLAVDQGLQLVLVIYGIKINFRSPLFSGLDKKFRSYEAAHPAPLPASFPGNDPANPITTCGVVLTQSGTRYLGNISCGKNASGSAVEILLNQIDGPLTLICNPGTVLESVSETLHGISAFAGPLYSTSALTIQNCVLTGFDDGIQVNGLKGSLTLMNNRVQGSHGAVGFNLLNNSGPVLLSGNTAFNNNGSGFKLFDSGTVLLKENISCNNAPGYDLWVSGSHLETLGGNRCTNVQGLFVCEEKCRPSVQDALAAARETTRDDAAATVSPAPSLQARFPLADLMKLIQARLGRRVSRGTIPQERLDGFNSVFAGALSGDPGG